MSRDRKRYLSGLGCCLAAGAGTLFALWQLAPGRDAEEQGPQRWLLVGGACVLPAALFYGWVIGAYAAGKVLR